MSFEASQQAFDAVFGDDAKLQPESPRLSALFLRLQRYLADRPGELPKRMAQAITDGESLIGFNIRDDYLSDLSGELYAQDIPFCVVVSSDSQYGIVARAKDAEVIGNINKIIVEQKARYCRIVSGHELASMVAKQRGKSCVSICGGSAEWGEIFCDTYHRRTPEKEPTLGLDTMTDETVMLTMAVATSGIMQLTAPDHYRIFLEAVLKDSGPNQGWNEAKAEERIAFREKLAKNFANPQVNLNRTPYWIVGSGRQYVCVRDGSFSYGRAVLKQNAVEFVQEKSYTDDKPDYDLLLSKYAYRITDPAITLNKDEAIRHFNPEPANPEPDYLDGVPNSRIIVTGMGESFMAGQIDQMIKRKISHDAVMIVNGQPSDKLKHYIASLREFLIAFTYERYPKGYDKESLDKLFGGLKKYKIEAPQYRKALKKLDDLEIVETTDEAERIADIGKYIEEIKREKEEREQEKEEEKEPKRRSRRKPFAKARRADPEQEQEERE